jgi:N6-adenosine-specific RNA methylase IME4
MSVPEFIALDSLSSLLLSFQGPHSHLLEAAHLPTLTLPTRPYCGPGRGGALTSEEEALGRVHAAYLKDHRREEGEQPKKRHREAALRLPSEEWCTHLLHSKRVYFNQNTSSSEHRLVQVTEGVTAVLPPDCVSVMSDVTMFNAFFTRFQCSFTTVVADPPWPSKSVKRAGAYWTRSLDHVKTVLLGLKVPPLLGPRPEVLIWVTNDPKVLDFVKASLLPSWLGVSSEEVVCEHLTWVKVATSGELVVPLGNRQRKTYETCVVGRRAGDPPRTHRARVMFSSPLWHSAKPDLDAEGPGRLELFARRARQGWHVWGNQALLRSEVDPDLGS